MSIEKCDEWLSAIRSEIQILNDFEKYYRDREALLHQTATSLKILLSNLLDVEAHTYLSITSRVKDLDSCLSKIERKKYPDPMNSITDLVGLRVIVYFEHQIKEVETLIRENIDVDEKYSSFKDDELGKDRIGYRSLHLTGKISSDRAHLKEYQNIADQNFEIQIRTVLQHAWAELAHDRAYKLSGGLPLDIQRNVNLYAGLLEIADKAFSNIVREVEEYKKGLETADVSLESVNSLSLTKFCEEIAEKYQIDLNYHVSIDELVTSEALKFGYKNIGDIENHITNEFVEAQHKYEGSETPVGLIRSIMMWNDPEKYFRRCWNNSWSGISISSFDMLLERHPNISVLLDEFEIEVLDNDEEYQFQPVGEDE